ncbi:PREDICTED: beta-carotene 3-hydroxylase 1, chloroplastic-like isoform X2 [Tarenaya hassleriana]|uniref:beta-carotene 3-hydroxylase 1, chloroplastic-like isoform X2 n=1 Tax=Tarenaya hassleriana TaxID=28532 RepID=UPI00053C69CD|nr:PREDICTED: beta-carotene 3-hydroxylase 1, chloroplastic-like isoform X2 [Tarenaya hassleriana]
MAAGLSVSVTIKPLLRSCSTSDFRRLHHHPISATVFAPLPRLRTSFAQRRSFAVCFVVEDQRQSSQIESPRDEGASPVDAELLASRLAEKLERKKSERFTYLVAAVGMEFWARWAHRALWHASLWHMHESHHKAREGPFELNDVFAVINAVPAVGLFSYGFFNKGFVPGLCFGAGLGITVFGIAYMFVHDGLVHKRFPVGPIANVPYFRRVAAAHQLHHTDKFKGVPYGLFLGPKEVEEVGGKEELEKEISKRIKLCKKG